MASVRLEVTAAVEDAVNNISRLEGTLRNAGTSLGDLPANARSAFSAIGQFTGAVQAAIGVVQDVVNPTIEYGKQVRDLGAFAGITAEEASRLIQVTDDLGIEFTAVRTAAKAMSENGLQPSVRNLAKLADEFNAIQDPVERSQFLVDKFGARAGPQMAIALQKGSAALLQMGKDAEKTGLVVGQDFVDQTEKARIAIDEYEDSILAAKVALSEELLPAVTATITQGANFITYWSKSAQAIRDGELSLLEFQKTGYEVIFTSKTLAEATEELTQVTDEYRVGLGELDPALVRLHEAHATEAQALDDEQAKLRANWGRWGEWADAIEQAGDDYATGLEDAAKRAQASFSDLQLAIDGPVKKSQDEYYQRQKEAGAVIVETQDRIKELTALPQLTDEQRAELAELQTKLGEQKQAYEDNATAHEEATARIVFSMLEQKLAMDGYTQEEIGFLTDVGEAWGIYDTKTADTLRAVDQAITTHGLNANAVIDTLQGKIDALPTVKTVTINVETHYMQYGEEPPGGVAPPEIGPDDPVPSSGAM